MQFISIFNTMEQEKTRTNIKNRPDLNVQIDSSNTCMPYFIDIINLLNKNCALISKLPVEKASDEFNNLQQKIRNILRLEYDNTEKLLLYFANNQLNFANSDDIYDKNSLYPQETVSKFTSIYNNYLLEHEKHKNNLIKNKKNYKIELLRLRTNKAPESDISTYILQYKQHRRIDKLQFLHQDNIIEFIRQIISSESKHANNIRLSSLEAIQYIKKRHEFLVKEYSKGVNSFIYAKNNIHYLIQFVSMLNAYYLDVKKRYSHIFEQK